MWENIRRTIPSLNTSTSSLTGRIVEVCGTFMDIVMNEILRSEQIIEAGTRRARITGLPWHLEKAYAYQEGDDLITIDESTREQGYAVIDPTKQIIKHASISSTTSGVVYINVATADADNNVVKLTPDQLAAFSSYYANFVGLGATIIPASNDPAVITADNLYIRYESTYNLDNIKDAVYKGLHDIQVNRRTSNVVYVNEIEGYLRGLPGITDAYLSNPTSMYDNLVTVPTDGSFTLVPGYFNFDPELYNFDGTKTIFQISDAIQVS